MTNKILRPCTIIPNTLYVKRGADRQVKQIVDDMGRPGYVLVARQMGKTNLLLNARREIASGSDCFVYVDVSNPFPTLRDFFRNLIDVALDSLEEIFAAARSKIQQTRITTASYPAHKEHESELRVLLKELPGKLVICLDEIDALTKTDYSDNAFSFIRSVYFSGRVNVPAFERLTYLLSGVAEPTELIKNKDISPFNIGAKIYLEDFSDTEFKAFINRAKLEIDESVIQRIFHWTNGHPRISWDVASKIEDIYLDGTRIDVSTVDYVVKNLYLDQFDLPPIDSIRKLAEEDKEVRNAVVSIHYERDASIPDPIRMKLYLNGIIKTPKADSRLELRNRILEESLSVDWIRDIEKSKLSLLERAEAAYLRQSYEEAVDLYNKFLASSQDSDQHAVIHARLGVSLMHSGRYEQALSSLEKAKIRKTDSLTAYLHKQFNIGLVLLLSGKADECIPLFKEVISEAENSEGRQFHLESLVNLCAAYETKLPSSAGDLIRVCQEALNAIKSINTQNADRNLYNPIICGVKYRLAKAYASRQENSSAEQALEEAIQISEDGLKVSLIAHQIPYVGNYDRRRERLQECVNIIIERKLLIKGATPLNAISLTEDIFSTLISSLAKDNLWEFVSRLLSYIEASEFDTANSHKIIYLAAFQKLAGLGEKIARVLLMAGNIFKNSGDFRRDALSLAITIDADLLDNQVLDYLQEIIFAENDSVLRANDARALVECIRYLHRMRQINRAKEMLEMFHEKVSSGHVEDMKFYSSGGAGTLWLSYLDYLLLDPQESSDKRKVLFENTRDLLLNAKGLYPERYFFDGELSEIKSALWTGLANTKISSYTRSGPKISRNDIVTIRMMDGTVIKGKFKKFSSLIQEGKATLVHNAG